MECKNCKTKLKGEKKFCTKCGAKVIDYKLTFSSITQEFFATFISWDNKFLKTIKHTTIKPEKVINDYLNGVRKRYMQPFAFLIIILTIYGIYLYFAKDFINESVTEMLTQQKAEMLARKSKDALENPQKNIEFAKRMGVVSDRFNKIYYNALMNHPNLFSFIFIPISAIVSFLVFRKSNYNFIEHNIIFTYTNAMYSLFATILGWINFITFKDVYYSSIFTITILLLYYVYVFKRVFKLSYFKTFYKSILFFILLGFTFVFFIMFIFLYAFLTTP